MPRTVTLETFAVKSRRLYSLPAVAIEVLDLTSQPQIDVRAIKECIENDPALTAKVLRVVNSSLFGLTCEVTDLGQAIALLGIKPLKLLVLGFSLSGTMADATGHAAGRYWRHTLTKAVAARELSREVWRLPGDEPFIAALLQDLGVLVLIQEFGEPYAKLVQRALQSSADLAALESEAIGFSHRQLTIWLLEHWRLPLSLIEVMRRAGHVAELEALPAAERAAPLIVHLASLIADLVVDGRKSVLPELLRSGLAHRLTPAHLSALVRDLQAKVAQLADVFSVQLPPGLDYRDVLIQAHDQLSQVADDVAGDLVDAGPGTDPESRQMLEVWEEVSQLSEAAIRFVGRRDTAPVVAASTQNQAEPTERGRITPLNSPVAPASLDVIQHETGLLGRLKVSTAACRKLRLPMSLALVEIDGFRETSLEVGPVEAEQLAQQLGALCQGVDHPHVQFVQTHEARFALILPDCDRSRAVELGNQLIRATGGILPARQASELGPLTISLGIASASAPAKNFAAAALAESAARCLDAAQLSGGNKLKSIDVY